MTAEPEPETSAPLQAGEIARVRELLGTPTLEQRERAIEEVERQVAVEDLVLLMVEGIAEAANAFFGFIGEIIDDAPAPTRGEASDKEGT